MFRRPKVKAARRITPQTGVSIPDSEFTNKEVLKSPITAEAIRAATAGRMP